MRTSIFYFVLGVIQGMFIQDWLRDKLELRGFKQALKPKISPLPSPVYEAINPKKAK